MRKRDGEHKKDEDQNGLMPWQKYQIVKASWPGARDFKKGWPKASVAAKKRLIRRLIDRLIYTREGLHTYYVTAKDIPTFQPIPQKKMASESSSGAIPKNIHYLKNHHRQPLGQLSDESVLRVRSGGELGN